MLRAEPDGSSIEKLSITLPGVVCLQPAVVQTSTIHTARSLTDLLGGRNPCNIPEKALHREAKRCKHCLVFSGLHVAMELQCGGKSRLITQEVLDHDLFGAHPDTPEYTVGTYKLLEALNQLFHSSEFDQPILAVGPAPETTVVQDAALDKLRDGGFDRLFPPMLSDGKVSEIYRQAQQPRTAPSVVLLEAHPFAPIEPRLPGYPPIGRAAHVQGNVRLRIEVGSNGTNTVSVNDGSPMLSGSAVDEAKSWKFDADAAGKTTEATLQYNLNCQAVPLH